MKPRRLGLYSMVPLRCWFTGESVRVYDLLELSYRRVDSVLQGKVPVPEANIHMRAQLLLEYKVIALV